MTGPTGNSEFFCFPSTLNVPFGEGVGGTKLTASIGASQ